MQRSSSIGRVRLESRVDRQNETGFQVMVKCNNVFCRFNRFVQRQGKLKCVAVILGVALSERNEETGTTLGKPFWMR